jgi:hypothetical protein
MNIKGVHHMLKKSLLASIALLSINSTLASPEMQAPAHGASNCPPCPCGGVQGWVLIPAGPGATCHQGAGATTSEAEVTPHHQPAAEHHQDPGHHKPAMHPEGRTPEQQKLEDELHPITPHLFLRANPNSPTPNKKEGEWGKELNDKVYFRHLGNWVYDPSVKPTDIISTGVKDKIKKLNGGGSQAAHAATAHTDAVTEARGAAAPAKGGWTKDANGRWVKNTAAVAEATPVTAPVGEAHKEAAIEAKKEAAIEAKAEAVVEAKKEAAAEATPAAPTTKPASKGGWTKDAKGRWTRNTPPDALGTTARPNTVDANGQPIQGSFNKAQTGQTGGPAPQIDASANSPQPAGN